MKVTYLAIGLIAIAAGVLALELAVGATRLLGAAFAALRSGR